jgi:hypothetical protein
MQLQRSLALGAAALLAAVAATLVAVIPTLSEMGEAWKITVVVQVLSLAKITLIVALGHAFILGLPLFLVLRLRHRAGIIACAVGGFVVGAVPLGAVALMSLLSLDSASTGGHPTVVNGVPTLAGLIEFAGTVGWMGLIGLAGGLTFFAAIRVSGEPVRPDVSEVQPRNRIGRRTMVSAATLLTCAVLVLPAVVKDRSCHNLFRDGRTSANPQIGAELALKAEDWPSLQQLFVNFGTSHSLSFRSDEAIRRGNVEWRELNLCDDGIYIDAEDRPWLAQINSPLATRGISFGIFLLKPDSGWQPVARDLLGRIDATWPGKTTFRAPTGKVISIDEALKGRN